MEEIKVVTGDHPVEHIKEETGAERPPFTREKIWSVRYALGENIENDPAMQEREECVREIAEALGVSPITARLLYIRGYKTKEEAEAFVRNDDAMLHDPFLMKDMDAAVRRIRRAVEEKERIVIYGDYDVDGVTSVSLFYLFLTEKGNCGVKCCVACVADALGGIPVL